MSRYHIVNNYISNNQNNSCMTECKFLIHGATTDKCHNYALSGICDYHTQYAKHIIRNNNYNNYNQYNVCFGINSSDYSLCTNQSTNNTWFCKTHSHQNKKNNLEFVNFVRENQGYPVFMDWTPTRQKTTTFSGLINFSLR